MVTKVFKFGATSWEDHLVSFILWSSIAKVTSVMSGLYHHIIQMSFQKILELVEIDLSFWLNWICTNFSCIVNSSSRLNSLGVLCYWQCYKETRDFLVYSRLLSVPFLFRSSWSLVNSSFSILIRNIILTSKVATGVEYSSLILYNHSMTYACWIVQICISHFGGKIHHFIQSC